MTDSVNSPTRAAVLCFATLTSPNVHPTIFALDAETSGPAPQTLGIRDSSTTQARGGPPFPHDGSVSRHKSRITEELFHQVAGVEVDTLRDDLAAGHFHKHGKAVVIDAGTRRDAARDAQMQGAVPAGHDSFDRGGVIVTGPHRTLHLRIPGRIARSGEHTAEL